jgi:hypothetical protein
MMPNHPRMIGDLRLSAALISGVGMSGMVVGVSMGRSTVLRQIPMGIVRNRIATTAANHARLVRALFINAVSFPQTGVDAEIGRRN